MTISSLVGYLKSQKLLYLGGIQFHPQTIIRIVKDICSPSLPKKVDGELIANKSLNMVQVGNVHDYFTLCTVTAFSAKDGESAFRCVVFYKSSHVYAQSCRGGSCVFIKKAEASSPFWVG